MTRLTKDELDEISRTTLEHYDCNARAFWEGTRDHDESQNIEELLEAIPGEGPFRNLDLGCGPGRDLLALCKRAHHPIGLDGAETFVAIAREVASVEVWHQDLLALDLPDSDFDGVFANASLFHVPAQELPRVLREVHASLRPGGPIGSSGATGGGVETRTSSTVRSSLGRIQS